MRVGCIGRWSGKRRSVIQKAGAGKPGTGIPSKLCGSTRIRSEPQNTKF